MKNGIPEISAKDVKQIRKKLLKWYDVNKRDLPWRHTSDPYHILVSEVMLQQTQVKTVIPYYQDFLSRFPSIGHLADATLQDVLKAWEGLGYYARARNLHRAALMIVTNHQGRLPEDDASIQRLPGIGGYIAAAVLSIAFGQARAVVDGNVKRVLARLFCMIPPVNAATAHTHFQAVASAILEASNPGDFNQAMMELGALTCKPSIPECSRCPLRGVCRAFLTGTTDGYPRREERKAVPVYHVSTGVIWRGDRVLITRRKPEGLLGGMWEFPGGKVNDREEAEAACIREIKEETNIAVEVTGHVTRVKHAYSHFKIIMDVFCCRYLSGRIRLAGPTAHRWITLQEIENYPFPKANHKFFEALFKHAEDGTCSGLADEKKYPFMR